MDSNERLTGGARLGMRWAWAQLNLYWSRGLEIAVRSPQSLLLQAEHPQLSLSFYVGKALQPLEQI